MITSEAVYRQLEEVLDPELMIDIVNLGLVYDVALREDGKHVEIVMTLTTLGCPAFDNLRREIIGKVEALPGVERVDVELTFDPPWTKERMSEEAQTMFKYLF